MTDAAEVKTLVKALNVAAANQGPTAAEVRVIKPVMTLVITRSFANEPIPLRFFWYTSDLQECVTIMKQLLRDVVATEQLLKVPYFSYRYKMPARS